jgi:hypothetical protein
MRIGVMYWSKNEGIASLISSIINKRGHEVVDFVHDASLPAIADAIFAYAPFGSLVPLAQQILARPHGKRPLLAFWLTEPLPDPRLPEWLRGGIGTLRSLGERFAYRQSLDGIWRCDRRSLWFANRAFRYRYYGDLFWLQRAGILSVLAVTSRLVGNFLRTRGFDPVVAYVGSHPDWYDNLELDRDIPVLWLGKIVSKRRRRLLDTVRQGLHTRGIDMHVVDGVENPYVFGRERNILLNRTVITLNLLREEYDDNSLRYFLAAPNRALIVSEPTLPHTPFMPNVHLVEAPAERIPDTIAYYLANEQARMKIVEAAYQLTTQCLTMENAVDQILQRVLAAYELDRGNVSDQSAIRSTET